MIKESGKCETATTTAPTGQQRRVKTVNAARKEPTRD
jgi:hypothetical protein